LVSIQWLFGDVSGSYDATTTEAVRGFQAKRGSRSPARSTSAPWTACTR
jgi:hypothetical protein